MAKLENITNWAALQALLDTPPAVYSRQIDAEEMTAALNERVKGQAHVIGDLARFLQQQWAKEKRRRPVANLLFGGFRRTGKTELVKAMAEYLYKDEKAILRIDCSELNTPEARTRLVGGYVGECKGQLTGPVLNNPKRLIVFDEIGMAHTMVLDLLLQVMGDGRLEDQSSGKVADFTQSIVILTSSEESWALGKLQEEIGDPGELDNEVKSCLVATGRFRPEFLGRLDKVYIFKELDRLAFGGVAELKTKDVARAYGLELVHIDEAVTRKVVERAYRDGVRSLEREIGELADDQFAAARERGCKRVRLDIDDGGGIVLTEVEETMASLESTGNPPDFEMSASVALKMGNVAADYGLELVFIDPYVILKAVEWVEWMLRFSARGLEYGIVGMLAEHFAAAREAGFQRIRIDMEEDGTIAIGVVVD
jgi:ATP-dependent Clp protease ATP-binding subunit ClpA